VVTRDVGKYQNLLNPSYPPFSKGRIYAPLWQRGARGDFIQFNYPPFTEKLRREGSVSYGDDFNNI